MAPPQESPPPEPSRGSATSRRLLQSPTGRRLVRIAAPGLGASALVLALWQAIVWSSWRPPWVLPPPSQVFARLGRELLERATWTALEITLERALVGYAIALALGSAFGLAMARLRWLRAAFGGLMTGLQTMPSIAWFPLAILLFQLGEAAILFVVVLGAAPSIANGLVDSIGQVPPLLVKAGRALGAGGFTLYRRVVVPAALPGFLNGLKQGFAFAWRSLMAGELIVTFADRPSIGMRLSQSRELADAEGLLAWMVVVLVLGVAVHHLGFGIAERRMLRRRGLLGATR
jgi:sulfonate transport system permease protein